MVVKIMPVGFLYPLQLFYTANLFDQRLITLLPVGEDRPRSNLFRPSSGLVAVLATTTLLLYPILFAPLEIVLTSTAPVLSGTLTTPTLMSMEPLMFGEILSILTITIFITNLF